MAATASLLTHSIVKLELLCNENVLSTATGFYYQRNGEAFMATNWHVLSGRDTKNGQPRHSSAAVPTHCRFHVPYLKKAEKLLHWYAMTYPLNAGDDDSPVWFEHPRMGQSIDVAAFQIDPKDRGISKDLLDPTGHDPSMLIDIGGEVFLPGYPLGLSAMGAMPIWKRASVASSLEIGEGIDQFFLVDTASREGMSGAPCIAISNWQHYSLDRKSGKVSVVHRPLSWRLLGIYSGRLNPSDSFEAQLGLVWREGLLAEIVAAKKKATIALRTSC